MQRNTTIFPISKQRLLKSQFLQKLSCKKKPYWDQARLSSLHVVVQGDGCTMKIVTSRVQCTVKVLLCRFQGAGLRIQGAGCKTRAGSLAAAPHPALETSVSQGLAARTGRREE